MKLFLWIILLPVTVAVVLFAVANRGAVTVDFWPLAYSVSVPLYLGLLATLVVGFVLGGVVCWLSQHRWRRRARSAERRAAALEREMASRRPETGGARALPPAGDRRVA